MRERNETNNYQNNNSGLISTQNWIREAGDFVNLKVLHITGHT